MTVDQIVELLNQDLRNEYKHHRFYLHCSFVLRGFDRLHFGSWLKGQSDEELGHVKIFADKIVALGGQPTVEANDFPTNLTDSDDILKYALTMEQEVVTNYHVRLKQAHDLYEETGQHYDLVLLYEEQIEDSQRDIDEMLRFLPPVVLTVNKDRVSKD